MDLKTLRIEKKLTQKDAAEYLGVSLRSYKYYENDDSKKDTIKYKYFLDNLSRLNPIDEEHGLLTMDDIVSICGEVLSKYDVSYCVLFGSYAKGTPNEASDVDLLVSTTISGLKFFGMVEELREKLHKRVDVLELKQLKDNFELTSEILKDGIKIYG